MPQNEEIRSQSNIQRLQSQCKFCVAIRDYIDKEILYPEVLNTRMYTYCLIGWDGTSGDAIIYINELSNWYPKTLFMDVNKFHPN